MPLFETTDGRHADADELSELTLGEIPLAPQSPQWRSHARHTTHYKTPHIRRQRNSFGGVEVSPCSCAITAAVFRWHVGDVVRKLREEQGFASADELAKKAGVDRATVYRLENTGRTKPKTLELVAAALGVRAEALEALVPRGVKDGEAAPITGPEGSPAMSEDRYRFLKLARTVIETLEPTNPELAREFDDKMYRAIWRWMAQKEAAPAPQKDDRPGKA